jgi:ubiquinone/menaquinone biosynthesis C-methylase UbiE
MKQKEAYAIKGWKGFYRKPENYDITSIWFDPTQIELKTLLKLVNFKNKIVLDVGAGTGRLDIPISKIAQRVCAIEPQEEMLEYMKDKIGKIGLKNIEFKKASAEDIPYPNDSFNVVLCTWVMSHLKDSEKSFYEMKRVLKRNGILLIIEHAGNDDYEKLSLIENPECKGRYEKRRESIMKQLKDFQNIKTKIIDSYIEFPNLKIATKVINELKGSKASKYVKENRMLRILNKMLFVRAEK